MRHWSTPVLLGAAEHLDVKPLNHFFSLMAINLLTFWDISRGPGLADPHSCFSTDLLSCPPLHSASAGYSQYFMFWMHFCLYSMRYCMMHCNLQMFAFNFSSLHFFKGPALCVDKHKCKNCWPCLTFVLQNEKKASLTWTLVFFIIAHWPLLYWSFQEISCWHAECSVSQPLTISLQFTQT